MKPPIIVYESGDVTIFQSTEDAERYLESPDVAENRYVAYDSEGRLLELRIQRSKSNYFLGIRIFNDEKVTISTAEYKPSHNKILKKILRELLKHFDVQSEWLQKATLNDLLEKSIEKVGFTK